MYESVKENQHHKLKVKFQFLPIEALGGEAAQLLTSVNLEINSSNVLNQFQPIMATFYHTYTG